MFKSWDFNQPFLGEWRRGSRIRYARTWWFQLRAWTSRAVKLVWHTIPSSSFKRRSYQLGKGHVRGRRCCNLDRFGWRCVSSSRRFGSESWENRRRHQLRLISVGSNREGRCRPTRRLRSGREGSKWEQLSGWLRDRRRIWLEERCRGWGRGDERDYRSGRRLWIGSSRWWEDWFWDKNRVTNSFAGSLMSKAPV